MKSSSIHFRTPKGGGFGWFFMIVLIAGVIWGGFQVYRVSQARKADRIEQAQKAKEEEEQNRLAAQERDREIKARQKAELERRQQAKDAAALELKRQEQAKREEEEARIKAEAEAQAQEEARRKAEEEERVRREMEEANQNAADEPAQPDEPEDTDTYPKPLIVKVPDLSEYSPPSKDSIPMDADQVVGTWSWDTAKKYDEITSFPTNTAKWNDREKAGAMAETYKKWREQEPGRIKASPSAKDFPGVPEDGAPLVARTIAIDSSIGGWHSTGLYAPPGAEITFSFSGSVAKDSLSVRIGCHTDDLMHKETTSWARLPVMGNSAPVGKARVSLADPCGGLVYVCVNNTTKQSKAFKVRITGATPAPLYVMGETTPEQWKNQLETTKAPWGEIRTPRLIFTMPLDRLKECEKIKEVAELLQKCMALQDWVAGWDDYPDRIQRPMRFVTDRQISIGYGHSGYPAMGSLDWANSVATGKILTDGDWGLWHELGHNHQGNPVSMEGQGEVSVNIFSMLCQSVGVGIDPRQARGMSPTEISTEIYNYLSDKKVTYSDAPNGVQLFLWGELMYHFGPEPFREVHKMYHKKPYDGGKTSDEEKWNWIMKAFGKAVQKDLTEYFETWKLPVNNSTRTQLKKYPAWKPAKGYPDPSYLSAK